jgi:preprotein translocase subunit SecG
LKARAAPTNCAAQFLYQESPPVFAFLLIVQTVVAISLIGVILMQRSEGGGLGVGGSSSGFMTARGAADFLTRSTAVLGGVFIVLTILMAAIAGVTREPVKIDTSLANQAAPLQQQQQSQPAPAQPVQTPAPEQNQDQPAVPLAQ